MSKFSFKPKNVTATQYITLIGLLTAIGTVLDAYLIIPLFSSWMKVTFGYIPEAVAALLLGPGAAVITATLTDIFATLLHGGDFSFLFVGLAVIQGAITGFILNRRLTLKRIVLNRVAVNAVINIFLNTVLLDQMGYIAWSVRLPLQLVKCPVTGASEIIILSVILPAIVNSVRRFGFKDVYIEENISINSAKDFSRRFAFPVTEAVVSLAPLFLLAKSCVKLTFNGASEALSYFAFFGKPFNDDLKIDFGVLALMIIPIILTTAAFLLAFSKKYPVKIAVQILNISSAVLIFEDIIKPYIKSIGGLSSDFSAVSSILILYSTAVICYIIAAAAEPIAEAISKLKSQGNDTQDKKADLKEKAVIS